MTNTLFGRLLIASLLVLGLFFSAVAYISQQLFVDYLNGNKREQLKLQNYIMLSAAQFGDNELVIDEELREPRFEEFESGLYGFISNQQGEILWRSYSAHNLDVDPSLLKSSNPQSGFAEFINGPHYYRYQHTVLWEVVEDKPQMITFTVLEDNTPTLQEITKFQQRLQLLLTAITFVLILILLGLLRWGTLPFRKLARKLKQVENGDAQQLEGEYPRELRRLVNNLNELLATEKRQRERYHATLADLAHSLKTPLAVIQTELQRDEQHSSVIAEQAARMEEIIRHQLQRAVVTAPHKLGEKILIRDTVQRLTNALAKVYADKNINFTLDIDLNLYFKGDQRDLTEILGNLLDNACKYCKQQIKVSARLSEKTLIIGVHDDGNGIREDLRHQLLQRGLRADTRHSGEGLGLDITRDIVNSYHGQLTINDSPLGGALFLVSLPI